MSRTLRHTALVAASVSVALGATALAPAAAAAPNDATNVQTNSDPFQITVFPLGSSAVGPVNAQIDSLILDAGDVTAILDTVSLLSWVQGPIAR